MEVFVSYARAESKEDVDRMCAALEGEEALQVVRDQEDLAYRESISDFCERFGRSEAVVIVLSNAYLDSVYCMHELFGVFQHGSFESRIYPVVFANTDLSRSARAECARYWDTQIAEAEHRAAGGAGDVPTHQEYVWMCAFRPQLGAMLERVADMKHWSMEELKASDFEVLRRSLVTSAERVPAVGWVGPARPRFDDGLPVVLVEFFARDEDIFRRYRQGGDTFGASKVGSRGALEQIIRPIARRARDPGGLRDRNVVAREGEKLFELLFGGEEAWPATIGRVMEHPGAHPTIGGLRVRIYEAGDPVMADLPWRITAWQGHLLTENPFGGWLFELAPCAQEERSRHCIEVPSRILVVAGQRLDTPWVKNHLAALRHTLERATERTGDAPKGLLSVVSTRAELDKKLWSRPGIVYYLGSGKVQRRQLLLQLGDEAISLTELQALFVRAGVPPDVVYLNAAGTAPAVRRQLPNVPVVMAELAQTLSDEMAQTGLHWFHQVLVEGKNPVEALHLAGGASLSTTVAVHAEEITVRQRGPVGHVLLRHNLDRTPQRSEALTEVNKLTAEHGERRVQALVGWGTKDDHPDLLSRQLFEHVNRNAVGRPAFRTLTVRIPRERDVGDDRAERVQSLRATIENELRIALDLEDPHARLEAGLLDKAPRTGKAKRSILWIDFGVYGEGPPNHAAYEPKLTGEHLEAWWSFCAHILAEACPQSVRVVAVLAICRKNLEGYEDKLRMGFLNNRIFHNDPKFSAKLLPQLGKVRHEDIREFLSEPGARCPGDLRFELATSIEQASQGQYAKAVELLEKGMGPEGWWALLPKDPTVTVPDLDDD